MPKPRSSQTKPGATPRRRAKARTSADPPVESPGLSSTLEQQEIARLAHSYWEARGGEGGSPEEDWHRAEAELKARRAAAR